MKIVIDLSSLFKCLNHRVNILVIDTHVICIYQQTANQQIMRH